MSTLKISAVFKKRSRPPARIKRRHLERCHFFYSNSGRHYLAHNRRIERQQSIDGLWVSPPPRPHALQCLYRPFLRRQFDGSPSENPRRAMHDPQWLFPSAPIAAAHVHDDSRWFFIESSLPLYSPPCHRLTNGTLFILFSFGRCFIFTPHCRLIHAQLAPDYR